ncbi:xanthine dehydrogenase [Acidithiobacillus ferrivorans]|nr:xanthine dehydrogenase [Acidithiobacillus ferrivorans]
MNALASRQRPLLSVREAVVTRVRGSAPTAVGASMRLLEDGSLLGTVGGGRMEYQICQALRTPRSDASPALLSFTLGTADDQCCGGQVEICVLDVPLFFSELYQSGASRLYQRDSAGRLQLVAGITRLGRQIGSLDALTVLLRADAPGMDVKERHFALPAPHHQPLWIFGAGHVGRAIASMARELDFASSVFDPRPEWADPAAFPPEVTLVDTWSWVDLQTPAADVMVLIMTYSHAMDYALLEHFIGKPLAYLGVIASRSKAARFSHALSRAGHDIPDYLHMPMGLPGLGKKPPEIAISVLAELLQLRHQKADF